LIKSINLSAFFYEIDPDARNSRSC